MKIDCNKNASLAQKFSDLGFKYRLLTKKVEEACALWDINKRIINTESVKRCLLAIQNAIPGDIVKITTLEGGLKK